MAPSQSTPPAPVGPDPAGAQPASGGWRSRDILRATLIVVGVWLALQLLWVVRSVFFLAFLGILFGITLSAGVTWLHRRGIPRAAGALLLVLGFLGVLVGVGAIAAPRIAEQSRELQKQLPAALDRVEAWIGERQGVSDLLRQVGGGAGGQGERPELEGQAAQARPEPKSQARQPAGQQDGPDIRQTLAQQTGRLARNFFAIFSSTLGVLGGLLVITFVAVYIAIDPRTYRRGIMHLVPHPARAKAAEVLNAMGVSLRRWLVAQLVAMVAIGAITTGILLLLDVRAAVALGIIAGILEFVPFFGPIISAVPAIAMGFLDGPEKALWVAAAYLGIQQIEGNVLTPLLMKEGLDLPPVLSILSQAALGLTFGFIGLIIAIPLLGAIMVPIKLLYVQDVVGDEIELPGGASG